MIKKSRNNKSNACDNLDYLLSLKTMIVYTSNDNKVIT